jgi:predicted NAD/FAD-dependent oxidoreductase
MASENDPDRTFDHGAPFFTVATAAFERSVEPWIAAGVCARWNARAATWRDGALVIDEPRSDRVVGVPTMSAVPRHLAATLDVRLSCTVESLDRHEAAWGLTVRHRGDDPVVEGPFDAVVIAMPPPQAARLIGDRSSRLTDALSRLPMVTHWVSLLSIASSLEGVPDVISMPDDEVLQMLVREDSKPGRARIEGRSRWVAQARSDWSSVRYDADPDAVGAEIERASCRALGAILARPLDPSTVECAAAHRWGAARPAIVADGACLDDPAAHLVVCGDAFGDTGVESAVLSGLAAATRVWLMVGPGDVVPTGRGAPDDDDR